MIKCPECGSENTQVFISVCRTECGTLVMRKEEEEFEPEDPIVPYTYKNPIIESLECDNCGYFLEIKKKLEGEFYPSDLEEEVLKVLEESTQS